MAKIIENMYWPPKENEYLMWKMAEHSAWYSGEGEVLANFYNEYAAKNFLNVPYPIRATGEMFWGRQIKNQGEIFVHVPIAGDIAETSANFLFSESPLIRIAEAGDANASQSYIKTQDQMDKMLMESGFYRKILEGAETGAAIGGTYIKIAWDEELSEFPIPVIVQADRAVPEFMFGIMTAVTFWKTIEIDDSKSKVYRLLERYERGYIRYSLYLGTTDRLGYKIELKSHPDTIDLPDVVETVDALLAVYIPNMLPNRLDRGSSLGRSDLSGIEGLMDALDETYSSWIKDIVLAQAKIMIPESFMTKQSGKLKYNMDQMLYVKLDMDPLQEGNKITPTQFDIRADQFEKSALNLIERIVTTAGYSPQSFGLNIQGRAESGTALSLRERKSFSTKNKKGNYWQPALKRIVELMCLVYKEELKGKIELNVDVSVEVSDGITNNLNELATSIKMISDAQAASTETKVRLLHPDWNDAQILDEVDKIIEETGMVPAPNPDEMPDQTQLDNGDKTKTKE